MYTPDEIGRIKALYTHLVGDGRIKPTEIVHEYHVEVKYSDEARRQLVALIVQCNGFDKAAAAENAFVNDVDLHHIGNRTALGLTTGFFADDWAQWIPDQITKSFQNRAMAELDDLLSQRDIWSMCKVHSKAWDALYAEYEAEMGEAELDRVFDRRNVA